MVWSGSNFAHEWANRDFCVCVCTISITDAVKVFVSSSKVMVDSPKGRGKFMSIQQSVCVSVWLSSAEADFLLKDMYCLLCCNPAVCLCAPGGLKV